MMEGCGRTPQERRWCTGVRTSQLYFGLFVCAKAMVGGSTSCQVFGMIQSSWQTAKAKYGILCSTSWKPVWFLGCWPVSCREHTSRDAAWATIITLPPVNALMDSWYLTTNQWMLKLGQPDWTDTFLDCLTKVNFIQDILTCKLKTEFFKSDN